MFLAAAHNLSSDLTMPRVGAGVLHRKSRVDDRRRDGRDQFGDLTARAIPVIDIGGDARPKWPNRPHANDAIAEIGTTAQIDTDSGPSVRWLAQSAGAEFDHRPLRKLHVASRHPIQGQCDDTSYGARQARDHADNSYPVRQRHLNPPVSQFNHDGSVRESERRMTSRERLIWLTLTAATGLLLVAIAAFVLGWWPA